MRSLSKQHQILLSSVFLFLLLIPEIASAKILLDNVSSQFLTGTMKWQPIISGYAKGLFWKLAELDFLWTAIVWVKDRKEFGEIMMGFVGKIITLLMFYSLLLSAGEWIPQIIDSFSQIGKEAAASSGADVGTLDSILFQGFNLAYAMFGALGEGWSLLHPLDAMERVATSIFLVPSALIVALCFSFIAGQLLVTLIESYIAIYGGQILLGFGGSRWTSEMATGYLKFAIGTGIKLMLCYLVIGLGFNIITMQIDPAMMKTDFIAFCLTIVILSVLYVYIVFSIPGLASGMLSGSPNMSLGGLAGAAITAGAGLAGAGAAAGAMGGKAAGMMGSAAAEAGGAGKALKAGFDQNRTSGMGFGSSAIKAPVPGIKSAASMAGAKMVETGKSLSEGGKGMLGKAGDAINNSAGGKVASHINGGESAVSGDSSAASGSGSDSGGGTTPGSSSSASSNSGSSTSSKPGANSSQGASGGNSSALNSANSNTGDASGASIGSSDPHTKLLESMSKNLEAMANGPEQARKLHQKISSMRDFVPQDGATVQTSGISMGHTKD